jgi:hypothetical protein
VGLPFLTSFSKALACYFINFPTLKSSIANINNGWSCQGIFLWMFFFGFRGFSAVKK